MERNIFELASRQALRFDSPKGQLSVEDLWNLPLTSETGNRASLDGIGMALQRELRDTNEVQSLVKPVTSRNTETNLKFEIVKYVIDVRVAERDAAAAEKDRSQKKQRILELIDQKKDADLAGKSLEELVALANSL